MYALDKITPCIIIQLLWFYQYLFNNNFLGFCWWVIMKFNVHWNALLNCIPYWKTLCHEFKYLWLPPLCTSKPGIILHIIFGDNPQVLLKLSVDALVSVGRPEICQDVSNSHIFLSTNLHVLWDDDRHLVINVLNRDLDVRNVSIQTIGDLRRQIKEPLAGILIVRFL